jgi:uncharacterized protein DUF3352
MSDRIPPEDPTADHGPSPSELPPAPSSEPLATAMPPADPPKRRRGAALAVVLAIVLVVIAAGGALAYLKMRGGPAAVLQKLPAGADAAFVAHLDPAAAQKTNLFRLTEKFPDLGSREELTQRFNDMVDEALADTGMSHEDLSWIGGEAGGYVNVGLGAPEYALVLAVDDEGAARVALQHIRDQQASSTGDAGSTTTISGVEVWSGSDGSSAAVFDGVAVVASNENTMRSVIDTANGASSIEDDAVFQGVMDRLPEDNLGFAFVNVHELVSVLDSIPAGIMPTMPSTAELDAVQGAGIAVTAQPDGLALDTVVTTDPAKLTQEQRDGLTGGQDPNPLLALTPANAYAVLASSSGAGGLGTNGPRSIADALDQIGQVDPSAARMIARLHVQQLLAHLTGDMAVEIGPGSALLPVGATATIGIDDRVAVTNWLDRYLPVLLEEADAPEGRKPTITAQDHAGSTITSLQGTQGVSVSWAVLDDAVVIGLTPADVAAVIDLSQGNGNAITTDQGFTSATAAIPGTSNVVYVDVQAILTAVKGFLPPDAYQQFLEQGGRDIEPIEAVVAGGTSDENGTTARVVIEVP